MHHPRHHRGDTGAAVDVRRQHPGVHGGRHDVAGGIQLGRLHELAEPQETLERERHQRVGGDAQQPGIEDRLEGIGLRILEFARVANRRFEAVGRPGGQKHAAGDRCPARQVPGALDHVAVRVVPNRNERQEIGLDHVPGDQGHDSDQEQRDHRRDTDDLGRVARGVDSLATFLVWAGDVEALDCHIGAVVRPG